MNEKTVVILTTLVALANTMATVGMINPSFPSKTVDASNWMSTKGIQLITLGKFGGRSFLQLPADADKASELFQKVFGSIGHVVDMMKGIPQASNEGRKYEHQSHRDVVERAEQNMASDISQTGNRRDGFLQTLQQNLKNLHEAILALIRS